MPTRRSFLQLSTLTTAGLLLGGRWQFARAGVTPRLQKFVWPLPQFGADIPIASPDTSTYPGTDYFRIQAGEYHQQLHPQLGATRLWGYADATSPSATPVYRHLGPAVVAQSGRPVRVTFTNALSVSATHPLPVDTSLMGADGLVTRITPHLHGGHVPWPSDGGPYAWLAPDGTRGPSRVNWLPGSGGVLTDDNWYPNDQSARLMWYHDHAIGITRLNAYAGLAAPYIVTDAIESHLVASGAIPGLIPGTSVPLVIQDKMFNSDGSLWYPDQQDPGDIAPGGIPPYPSCVPEFFADTMLMNGIVYPYLEVQPRRYRFRILNACNSRFVRLQLLYSERNEPAEPDLHNAGPAFLQIGNEGGFLPAPVPLTQIILAPAERADFIVDFSAVPVGASLIVYNDAPAPFPDGDDATDYYFGSRNNPELTEAGFGPNTRTLMQFRVVPLQGPPDPRPAPLKLPHIEPLQGRGAFVRNLTLNEDYDDFGRLLQRLGNDQQLYAGTFGRAYSDPATETPLAGALEIWNVFNLTGDTHPVHFHLVNVQVVGRRKFRASRYNGTAPQFTGPMRAPDANELGWKETVRMNPGEMTQVIMRFDLPPAPPSVTVPFSPRFPGMNAHEYVWHCHILEHEEHDMMRPLLVTE